MPSTIGRETYPLTRRPTDRPTVGRLPAVDVDGSIDVDEDSDLGSSAGDIPLWQRDTISLSARARQLIGRIKPTIIRVLSFWDHRVTRLTIGDRTLVVDGSGS
jgi:hypothetical protein